MSKSAIRIVQAELEQAEKGLAYYQNRVQELREVLGSLTKQNTAALRSPSPEKKLKAGGPAKQPLPKPAKAPGGIVPVTGGDFWAKFITKEPKSAVEVAMAAAAFLKLDESRDAKAIKILKNRVSPSLASLVDAKTIKQKGAGRDRRYYV